MLSVLNVLMVIGVIVFLYTQLIVPAFNNKPFFPLFRSKESKLKAKIILLEQQEYERKLEATIEQREREIQTGSTVDDAARIPGTNTATNEESK